MRSRFRRIAAYSTAAATALAGAVLAVSPTAPASAVITGNVMSGAASPMWQTNAQVDAVVVSNGVVYAGGRFTQVRPPGTGVGSSQSVARAYLAAFNASTGALITTFNARVNGRVSSLAVSPDGTRLFLGGAFRSVGGVTRNRVAAVNLPTGSLVTTFNPNANATVNALTANANGVWFGGPFTNVGGSSRPYIAGVNPTTGARLAGFTPTVVRKPDESCIPGFLGCPTSGIRTFTPAPTAMQISPDGSRLLVGGNFLGFNGSTAGGMASLDPATGASAAWDTNAIQPINTNCAGRVTDIDVDGGTAYVTGEGDPPGCYEGTYSAQISDGALNWNSSCLGATQAIAEHEGILYKGSHEHDCAFTRGGSYSGYVGGTSRGTFIRRHLLAQDATDGSFVHWSPDTNGSGPQPVGPRAMDAADLADGTAVVVVGGDFSRVNDVNQQGLTRFVARGDTAAPFVPGRNINADRSEDTPIQIGMRLPLTVQPTAAQTLTVQVPAVEDLDTGRLTYRFYRDGGATPVATLSAESFPWSRPVLRFDDTGLAPGSTHSYRVSASDGFRTTALSTAVSGRVASVAPASYAATQTNLSPEMWWRLNDAGPTVADSSGNGGAGEVVGSVQTGRPGALADDSAVTLDGTTGYITSTNPVSAPNAFSQSAWFRTDSITGGVVVAQSDQRTGAGGNTDRLISMDNNGALVFAMKAGASGAFGVGTINIRNQGPVWNDGRWHHVVGTYDGNGGAALYVDGWLQGTALGTPFDATAKAAGMPSSYVRAGYADVSRIQVRFGRNFYNNKWPLSENLAGSIDEVSVFDRALTAGEIASLYAAGVGGGA